MSPFLALTQKAAERIPDLKVSFQENPNWASGFPDYRMNLRQALKADLQKQHPESSLDSIEDLKKIPTLPFAFISISHCPRVGAYVVSNKPVGIDVEVESRIRKDLVERICKKSELELTQNMAALWAAKEALFKAHRDLKVISDTVIQTWEASQDGIFSFSDLHFQGWVCQSAGLTAALAIKKTST